MNIEQLELEKNIAPFAIPLQEQELIDAKIDLADIPLATPANKADDLLICTAENRPQLEKVKPTFEETPKAVKVAKSETLVIERVKPNYQQFQVDQIAELSTQDPQKDTKSHFITDPHRFNTYFSACGLLCLTLSFISTIICVSLLLYDRSQKLYLIGPASLLLFGILYFMWIGQTRCCVCHQKQFVRGRNRKKDQAHYVKGIGYVIPTALHIIFRGFYKCMVCGSGISIFKK